jgi:hypothetical protein
VKLGSAYSKVSGTVNDPDAERRAARFSGARIAALRVAFVRTGSVCTALAGTALVSTALVGTAFIGTALAGQSGKVVEHGIYSEDHKLLEQTTSIPIKGAVRFGFCFEADIDFLEDRYMLIESLAHPPVHIKGRGEDTGYSVPRMFKVRDGVAHGCSGYRARDAADLRPGVWKFTISDGEEELVVQEFTVR